jgi:hypothetical protein
LLFPKVPYESASNLAYQSIRSFVFQSDSAEERAIGYQLLQGLIIAHPNEALDKESLLCLFFEEMVHDKCVDIRRKFFLVVHDLLELTQSDRAKQKKLFARLLHEKIIDGLADRMEVAIECIIIFQDFSYLFKESEN